MHAGSTVAARPGWARRRWPWLAFAGLSAVALAVLLFVLLPGARAPATSVLEVRWHQGGIVLGGAVRDEATRDRIVAGARARLGGEMDQVTDWLDIRADGEAIADPAALARLILRGADGWALRRRGDEAWLAVPAPEDPAAAAGLAEARQAFGPGVRLRLVAAR